MIVLSYYKHKCGCGCGCLIEIKRHHKYLGVPKYIRGHNCVGLKRGKMSEEHRKKISISKKVNPTRYWLDKKRDKDTIEKLRKANCGRIPWNKGKRQWQTSGENNPNWKGGVTEKNKLERVRFQQTLQKDIFKRDDYTCQVCGVRGGDLQAGHIRPWATHIELRFEVDNCRTICAGCHYEETFEKPMPPNIKGWGHNLFRKGV